jgi:NAD(P)-dependent dehydrogenase (short-subunit alcohol dehydrogenase family)
VKSASCAAVDSLARALAVDLAQLRVNGIQPWFVDTPLFDALVGPNRGAVIAAAAARLPRNRIGRPEEIADAVLFLMRNGYVTGINLVIDGGSLRMTAEIARRRSIAPRQCRRTDFGSCFGFGLR